jgi:hypothetical protein
MSQYTDLITAEHADRPKFVAVIETSTNPSVDQQEVVLRFPSDFDLDSAVGAQLDVVGEWVGVSRYVLTPLEGVYFTWGEPGLGWGEGYWRGPFDPTQGLTTLSDDFYRLLIRATIALNNWNGTLQPAIDAIAPLFPNNLVYIQDNQDMTISIAVVGPPLDVILAALLTGGYLALKPVTVRINYYFPTAPDGPVFGFGADNEYIGGWGTGSWGSPEPFTP